MLLSLEQIRSAASGASYVEYMENMFHFHRLSPKVEEMYYTNASEYYDKVHATAGVSLSFKTNSRSLELAVNVLSGSSRFYFSHDILVNGKLTASLKNFKDEEIQGDYSKKFFPLGDFCESFDLGEGEKTVSILFPALLNSRLKYLKLDDGASFEAAAPQKQYLALGDSITQGYDCTHPSNRYPYKLAQKFGAAEINYAIGGEVFRPALAEAINGINPDFITVAYGTNNFKHRGRVETLEDCRKFFDILSNKFPDKNIYVISPIFRADYKEPAEFGPLSDIEKMLKEICLEHSNLILIKGFKLVPHKTDLFGDLYLHPSDKGHEYYAKHLCKKIKE